MPTITSPTNSRLANAASVVSRAPAASVCCCPACADLECLSRTRFFAGQLLTEADLNNEQSYLLAKNRLRNRYLTGWGVVCGLQVICSNCDGWVTVKAGYAIDPCGNDIIVCADQPFNVAAAIRDCCKPVRQSNCTPPRPAPPASCQDAEQKWCITIQYKELPTRPVTPLKQPSSSGSSCGCGGSSKGGCGCGCGGHSSTSSSSSASCCCISATPPPSTAVSTACEPTRILETFQLGVCQVTDTFSREPVTNALTGMAAQISACIKPLEQLILQAPNFAAQGITSYNSAYSAACNYLGAAKKYAANAGTTHCASSLALSGMQIVKLNESIPALQAQVDSVVQQLSTLVMECFCLAAMPSCPPSPCDSCMILACITVRDGQIIDICHFGGGRQQIISFPSLFYWLSVLGVSSPQALLNTFFEKKCCAPREAPQQPGTSLYAAAFRSAKLPQRDISTAGVTNPALFDQIFTSGIAQQLGATVLNAATAANDTLDLRPFVGQDLQTVAATLHRYKIKTTEVDANTLSDSATSAEAPSAFPIDQPLTILTSSRLVVGFQPTSPTDQLRQQVAALEQQMADLKSQLGGTHSPRTRKG